MTLWPELPDCGVYLVWPESGTQWIHPDDIAIVNQWIPSNRVFRRYAFIDGYYHLKYGSQTIRVRPTLWLRVLDEGFSVGDRVEILSRFMENEPCIGVIHDIRFDKASNTIEYHITEREQPLPRTFAAHDLAALTSRAQLRERDTPAPTPRQRETPHSDRLKIDDL